jgi:hypothetical protein
MRLAYHAMLMAHLCLKAYVPILYDEVECSWVLQIHMNKYFWFRISKAVAWLPELFSRYCESQIMNISTPVFFCLYGMDQRVPVVIVYARSYSLAHKCLCQHKHSNLKALRFVWGYSTVFTWHN